MTIQPAALLLSLPVLCCALPAVAGPKIPSASRILLAQAAADPTTPAPAAEAPAVGTSPAPAGTPPAVPQATSANPGVPAPNAPAQTASTAPALSQSPAPTVPTRNGGMLLPTLAQPSLGGTNPAAPPGASAITFGGPKVDVQPVYGSTLRDTGAGNGGTPIYSNAPSTLGGPINGTANAYYDTLPNGAALPGQVPNGSRGGQAPNGSTYATQQPLGAKAYTRDQSGTFGGTTSGYNAQGIYNGTAAQTGVGYGSPYASTGRPVGGLLSTGVDASGPLRPYVPLDTGPIGRPNSGYGVPNGSRSTHMDGRGIQRLD